MMNGLKLPEGIRRKMGDLHAQAEDIGRSGAQVVRAEEMFLKIDAEGKLARAAAMQEYFAKKRLSAPLIAYEQSGGRDFLLVRAVPGEYACSGEMLREPQKLAALLGETMRMLHETDAADCPLCDANERAEAMYEAEHDGRAHEGAGLLRKEALVHGDHCLPNVFFENGRFSGYIDLGDAGIGDRHLDICCALWSLGYNTKSERWRGTLLDAYGREAVDAQRLALCMQLYGYE
ncbi:MAG: phosphotransferase [Eubacteriales bacterium]|nr:phosphotransferase [Eubacteriales bacterium]